MAADVYYSPKENNEVHFSNEPVPGWTKYVPYSSYETLGGAIVIIDLYDGKFELPYDATQLFLGAGNTTFNDTDKWVTFGTVSMNAMFRQCLNLTSIDMSTWDVTLVQDMSYMFAQCHSLEYINIKGWDIQSLMATKLMFYLDESLSTIDADPNTDWTEYHRISSDNSSFMFAYCSSLPGYTSAMENIETNHIAYANNTEDYGLFKQYPRTHTVTWYHEDGYNPYYSEEVAEGTVPVYTGPTPTKPSIGTYNYIFDGWSPTPTAIYDDAEYRARFRSVSSEKFTITFYDNVLRKTLQETEYGYGETPVYEGETPSIPDDADPWRNYTFTGWSPTIVPATADATYETVYTTADAYYTVNFYNWNGVLLKTVNNVKAGTVVEYDGPTPTRPADVRNTYEFKYFLDQKGQRDGGSILYDTEFVAEFTPTPIMYRRIFSANGHGTAPGGNRGAYGTVFPRPFPDPFDDGEWVFVDWYKEDTCRNLFDFSEPIRGEETVYAKWVLFSTLDASMYIKENGEWKEVTYMLIKDGGRS